MKLGRVPASSLLPSQFYLDHSHGPMLAPATLAALPWGRKNIEQHAAFQAMWVQYDHLIAHAASGTNDLENIVITCGPCNFGRMHYSLEQIGLIDPRTREPVRSSWEGLERFR